METSWLVCISNKLGDSSMMRRLASVELIFFYEIKNIKNEMTALTHSFLVCGAFYNDLKTCYSFWETFGKFEPAISSCRKIKNLFRDGVRKQIPS